MPEPTFTRVEEIQERFEEFKEWCKQEKRPLTVSRFAVFCDCDRNTITKYASGAYDNEYVNFSSTIKKMLSEIESDKVERGLSGDYNASVTIFDLKNNHGYVDKQDHDIQLKPPQINKDIPDE